MALAEKIEGKLASEGVLLVAITGSAYIIAYSYQIGFNSYWGIPDYFIDITLVSVSAAAIGLITLLMPVLAFMQLPVIMLDKQLNAQERLRRFFTILHLGVLAFILIVIMSFGWSAVYSVVVLIITIAFLDAIIFLAPWFSDRAKHDDELPFFKKIERNYEEVYEPRTLTSRLTSFFGESTSNALLVVLPLTIFIAFAAGRREAAQTTTFSLVENENLLIIKRHNENFILHPIDLSTSTVHGELLLWSQNELADKRLKRVFFRNITFDRSLYYPEGEQTRVGDSSQEPISGEEIPLAETSDTPLLSEEEIPLAETPDTPLSRK